MENEKVKDVKALDSRMYDKFGNLLPTLRFYESDKILPEMCIAYAKEEKDEIKLNSAIRMTMQKIRKSDNMVIFATQLNTMKSQSQKGETIYSAYINANKKFQEEKKNKQTGQSNGEN